MSVAAPVFADNGKSGFGCSSPFSLVTWDSTGQLYYVGGPNDGKPDPVTQAGLAAGTYTSAQVVTLWGILDHNGNKQICEKQPNGFVQDTKRINYDNLTDDKILS